MALDRPPYYLETNVPGVFAAGDVRHGSVKRCASAVGEGAMAVTFVHRYLSTDSDLSHRRLSLALLAERQSRLTIPAPE